jgi:hypothetical protein
VSKLTLDEILALKVKLAHVKEQLELVRAELEEAKKLSEKE